MKREAGLESMFFIPRSFFNISLGLERRSLTAIMVFKNTVATVVAALFGNDTSLAIIRCLLSSVIVAIMLTPCRAHDAARRTGGIDRARGQSTTCGHRHQ
jgi:hypothetical protein